MAYPQITASFAADYTTTGTTKSVSVTCANGDTLLVCAFGGINTTLSNPATAPGITFTAGSSFKGDGTYGALYYSYAYQVPAQSNVSVTMTESSGTVAWGFTCYVVKN